MKLKNLYLMCGIPGSGKSTWCIKQLEESESIRISRDVIRFSILKDGEDYFAHENDVFAEFIKQINEAIWNDEISNIYVDATHLNEKSRNKVLNLLDLKSVNIIPVNFLIDFNLALERNFMREGRSCVPSGSLLNMNSAFRSATHNEKYSYAKILNVIVTENDMEVEEI